LRAIAYWERLTLKELLEEVLVPYLETKEVIEKPLRKRQVDL
jgi:hypothetical protein